MITPDSLGSPMLSQKTRDRIAKEDAALNKRAGYSANALNSIVENLLRAGRAEVGWRESCGTTDPTMYTHRAWGKILKSLRADGLVIAEELQKHGNGWATKGGGFWNSIIYTLTPTVKESLTVAVPEGAHG